MQRGDVFDASLSPTEGSEQSGTRPVILVSRDAINQHSPVVVVVPLTDARNVERPYPTNVVISAADGGLTRESVALTGEIRAIARSRLLQRRGQLSVASMQKIDAALRITLNL